MTMNAVEITNVSKSYGKTKALNNINLSIRKGDCVLLVGHNGSGKSTLLKCILKHISYQGSTFCFDHQIGYIPEKALLPDFMTVKQFLTELHRLKFKNQDRIDELLAHYNLDDRKNHIISSLSKGMRQKLLIIQALLGEPQLLLFDEPLNGLDEDTKNQFMNDIKHLLEYNCTIVITTHHPEQYSIKHRRIVQFYFGEASEV
jgi:ABC-type multidrug transport system ATPase subunit